MKIKEFRYKKKTGEEGDYNLLILNESLEYLSGIDMNKLSDEEKVKLKAVIEKYEEELKPFMKAFRKFIVGNIIYEDKK